jgi:uncharacterized membrane protein
VVRLPAVLVPCLLVALAAARPWRWTESDFLTAASWRPSRRVVVLGAVVVTALLFWIVLTRFRSADINGVDFTVYFDRPCAETVEGRPLFVETADQPALAHRSLLALHAFWGLVPICLVYAVYPSPFWLLGLSVVAIGAGAMYVGRILLRIGASGALAAATALAFVLNDNTARTLNYGFHPEVLYAWFIPWMIDAGLRGARVSFVAATLATVLLKEDAVMPIFGVSVCLALTRWRAMRTSERLLFLAMPLVVAAINLGVYFAAILPRLTGETRPGYSGYWANYGATPTAAVIGMLSRPGSVIGRVVTSGFFVTVLGPHLFLPLIGWRWVLGIVPIVVLYGAAANEQMRAFGIYYAIILMPFLAIGAGAGSLQLARLLVRSEARAQLLAACVVLMGALLVGAGSRGYSLRPWKPEVAAVPGAVAALRHEPVLLVQSGLYPHAGYEQRVKLLTPETLEDAKRTGAAVLIAPRVHAYPFVRADVEKLTQLPPILELPGGLVAVRVAGKARQR